MIDGPDLGAPDPELLAALICADEARILAALASGRLLVAVAAVPGQEHASEGEMALALLESSDGQRALPVFTGLQFLTAWRADARPVARPGLEVVGYARAESMAAVVFDPGSPHSWTLWRSEFASAGDVSGGDPHQGGAADSDYETPTWKPSRKARRVAAPHEVYALDTGVGAPAIAVSCPEGTLDADWAQRLLAHCPQGTTVVALLPAALSAVRAVGVRL